MSKWTEPEEWERLRSGESCPICLRGGPLNTVAELEESFLTASAGATIRGNCVLFLKRHAVELHDLSPPEAAAFMRDARRVSRAVQEVTRAVKMNYEIHGNTIPHFHMHVFPRYVGDPFEYKPIDPRRVAPTAYGPGEFEEFVARVLARLRESEG
jgi:diadenosine tetraphosphate (Ap4A) HIT family hydrolase